MNLSLPDVLLVASILLPALVPLGQALYQHLLDRLPSNQRGVIAEIVRVAVVAADQLYSHAPGAVRKEQATAMIEAMLREVHIRVPSALISGMIELSVRSLRESAEADVPTSDSAPHDAGATGPMGFTPASPAPAPGDSPAPAPQPML